MSDTKPVRKILFVARDDGGCGFYRCRQPAWFLSRYGMFETEVVHKKPTAEQMMSADLVILQEMGLASSSETARFLVSKRIPYLSEFDDFIQHVSPNNRSGYGGWNPGTLMVHRAMEQARAGFGIQVSTEQLAREYFPYNPTVYVIPNWLDRDNWELPAVKRGDGRIRIGWAGGNAHGDDLKMISGVIDRISSEFGNKVVFETFGMTPNEVSGIFSTPPSPDFSCEECGHPGRRHEHWGVPLDQYPSALAAKGWDIALAPIIETSFNACKSDIKLKEYSALGIPAVASPVRPYLDAVKNGCPALLANGFDEWYDVLVKLIRDEDERQCISKEAKKWASGNWIQDRVLEIRDLYEKVINEAEASLGPKSKRNL